ncbi:MAG TPA: hypothetical protein VK911_04145 [Vicinamibacterales bacterium]|nr:hypothetical protein [Vicinamibacterales bacterium]
MGTRTLPSLVGIVALLGLVACDTSKSANPLSPSIAGPIPGVTITAPKPLEPGNGWDVDASKQPLTLLVENASSTGVRPLSYCFEVALDADFANKVLTREGVTPGEGRTSLRLPDALAPDRAYYWRARALDGANTGPFSGSARFNLFTPITIQAPTLREPAPNVRLADRTPTFVIANAARSGPVGPMVYTVQIALDQGFSQMVAHLEIPEQAQETRTTLQGQLQADTTFYWRARGWEGSKQTIGPWSATWAFITSASAPTAPPPSSPAPGDGTPSSYRTGPDVIAYITGAYPERLVATGPNGSSAALAARQDNMAFLRDRIIETGICGGMDLAWNLKRGVGPISIDALAWRHDGILEVVDVGRAFDDTEITLVLQWALVGGEPGYAAYYPRPACR